MAGRGFAGVGPSDAGKDRLMAEAKRCRPDLHVVRPVMPRPESAGREPCEGVSEAEGGLLVDWQSGGMCHGIPRSVERAMSEGRNLLFAGSRA